MADNYLEKRYNEVFLTKKTIKKVGLTLDALLLKNDTITDFDESFEVSETVMNKIISVISKISASESFTFKAEKNLILVFAPPNSGKNVFVSLGICLQTMMLKAVEIGFKAVIVSNFDNGDINPAAVLKVVKPSKTR